MNDMKIKDALFWERTRKNGRCRIWTGAINKKGYGVVMRLGRTWLAHRYAQYLKTGTPPDFSIFRQSCKTPSCVNPHHLTKQSASERMGRMLKVRWKGEHGEKAIQCPGCRSYQVLTRQRKQTRWCRRCGQEWKAA